MKIDNMAINIIISNLDAQTQVLVEIENDNGESIRIGEELKTNDGYRKLRISVSDIVKHELI